MMKIMKSKLLTCVISLCLVQSYAIFASANNTKKDYNATLQKYDFVCDRKNELNGNIKVFLKEHRADAIAFINCNKDSDDVMRVDFIDVCEPYQGKGLGSVLLQSAIKVAADFNCKHIRLLAYPEVGPGVSFHHNLERLVSWYRRFGFEPIENENDCDLGGQSMLASSPFQLDLVPAPSFLFK